ncbi:hypothetical protein BDK51DRAFT_40643 [Blyttiomyces helicus]|uniref:Uncharacterized protein n=1 Tax=Blyttiomyces helicus TaxID=388810 RepID=A0A4P9W6I1_9FUNG|nr:hypothetical protein BDK51DRAFT_40643 [Blyttiomyces helicus]|eukprot:RKO88069.1 hypothetical protein BDK51DRAFT_40643 [Blyttiomyces helicus]
MSLRCRLKREGKAGGRGICEIAALPRPEATYMRRDLSPPPSSSPASSPTLAHSTFPQLPELPLDFTVIPGQGGFLGHAFLAQGSSVPAELLITSLAPDSANWLLAWVSSLAHDLFLTVLSHPRLHLSEFLTPSLPTLAATPTSCFAIPSTIPTPSNSAWPIPSLLALCVPPPQLPELSGLAPHPLRFWKALRRLSSQAELTFP